jgi:hypothetical protein
MNKTIQFNSEFLSSVSKKKTSNGTRKKEKPGLSDKNNSKVLRQKLLEKIKEYQNRTTTDQIIETPATGAIDNTFTNSLEILKGLSSGIGHNKTVKHKPIDSDVSIEIPDCFKEDVGVNNYSISSISSSSNSSSSNSNSSISIINENKQPIVDDLPVYSCIKNGSRPTYKEMRYKPEIQPLDTAVSTTHPTPPPIVSLTNVDEIPTTTTNVPRVINDTTHQNTIDNIKDKRPQQTRKRMITKTYKYILGKNGKNVSVLLKDMNTRKMVKKECSRLTNTPIHDIKQYLRKKNLLKIGSNATDDVVKKIYEQSILTGEVRNMSKDTLIHNFMKT